MLVAFDRASRRQTRRINVEVVAAEGSTFPSRQVEEVLARNHVVFEPHEISQGKRPTVNTQAWMDPRISLDDLSHQLMRDATGVVEVSWQHPQALKPAAVASPQPVDGVVTALDQRRTTILDALASARQRIGLSLYRCTDKAVFEALAAAVQRGVTVDAIVTSRLKGAKKDLRRLSDALSRCGVSVHPYLDPVVKYHAKYLVVDDGPAIVTSLNFTKKCFKRTLDALVVTHDAAVVRGLWHLLQAGIETAPHLPADLPARLIVGPERARAQRSCHSSGERPGA